jgi:hypothetical protein
VQHLSRRRGGFFDWWKSLYLTNLIQRMIDDWISCTTESSRRAALNRLTDIVELAAPFVFAVQVQNAVT